MPITAKTKDGVLWVKVYNAGGTSKYEPACGGSWLSFWKEKMSWPSAKAVRCFVYMHYKENENNTKIDGAHVRYVGGDGRDCHIIPICSTRNVEVEEGKENTDDCFWVMADKLYTLKPGDSKIKK